jgi:hypothetical protein
MVYDGPPYPHYDHPHDPENYYYPGANYSLASVAGVVFVVFILVCIILSIQWWPPEPQYHVLSYRIAPQRRRETMGEENI